jgi:hypothetical protein
MNASEKKSVQAPIFFKGIVKLNPKKDELGVLPRKLKK